MRIATTTRSTKTSSSRSSRSSSRRTQLRSREGVCRRTRRSAPWMCGLATDDAFSRSVVVRTLTVALALLCPQKAKMGAAFRFCCSCSKSSCEKNYCECYKAGTGCEPWCKCSNCKNPHGDRDTAVMNSRASRAAATQHPHGCRFLICAASVLTLTECGCEPRLLLDRSGPESDDGPKGTINLDSLEHSEPLPGAAVGIKPMAIDETDEVGSQSHLGLEIGAAAAMQAAY